MRYLCLTAQSSLQNMGDFLAIVKEKNFIEVVSRSINQVDKLANSSRENIFVTKVIIITVDDPKAGSLNPASVIDSLESVESMAWPNPVPERHRLTSPHLHTNSFKSNKLPGRALICLVGSQAQSLTALSGF